MFFCTWQELSSRLARLAHLHQVPPFVFLFSLLFSTISSHLLDYRSSRQLTPGAAHQVLPHTTLLFLSIFLPISLSPSLSVFLSDLSLISLSLSQYMCVVCVCVCACVRVCLFVCVCVCVSFAAA